MKTTYRPAFGTSGRNYDPILKTWAAKAVRVFDEALREDPLLDWTDVAVVVSEKRGEVKPILYTHLREMLGHNVAKELDNLHESGDGFLLSVGTGRSIITKRIGRAEIDLYRKLAIA
jgi:hypothetical protein